MCFSRWICRYSAYESCGLATRLIVAVISLFDDFVEDLLDSESELESSPLPPERLFSPSFGFDGFAIGSPHVWS